MWQLSRIGLYPGSFDPVTYGHLDLIYRGSKLFDKLYIAIAINSKKRGFFTIEERKEMLEEVTKAIDNVEVVVCDKLTAQFAHELKATAILRGLRAVTDFEYEMQMASTNNILYPSVETVFVMTRTEYSFLSSSVVKEIARYGGDISPFVPPVVRKRLYDKFNIKY